MGTKQQSPDGGSVVLSRREQALADQIVTRILSYAAATLSSLGIAVLGTFVLRLEYDFSSIPAALIASALGGVAAGLIVVLSHRLHGLRLRVGPW